MDRLTDMALVARAAMTGDKRAFETLVRRYQEGIRRFFMHQTLGDKELSDDLAQDTFLKAWTALGGFKGTASFSTWIYRIACNVLYDHARRNRHEDDIDSAEAQRRISAAADGTLRMDIYAGLALLSPPERMCVTLQLVDGNSIDRIAGITGLSAGTVKSHLSRGKARLAKYLKQNGYE